MSTRLRPAPSPRFTWRMRRPSITATRSSRWRLTRTEMRRVLVANRGEIAVRVVRACFDEGLESVVAVSEADRDSLAACMADRAVVIGPAPAAAGYLRVERIIAAALRAGGD